LRQIPYGAYVIGTTAEDGRDHLMFGTWLMQTSFKPPLAAFAFAQDSRSLANVRRTKAFAISFLGKGMRTLAEDVLEGSFEKVKTDRTPSGLPIVAGGAGWIECKSHEIVERGDHRIVLAEVVDAGLGPSKPLSLETLGWHYGG